MDAVCHLPPAFLDPLSPALTTCETEREAEKGERERVPATVRHSPLLWANKGTSTDSRPPLHTRKQGHFTAQDTQMVSTLRRAPEHNRDSACSQLSELTGIVYSACTTSGSVKAIGAWHRTQLAQLNAQEERCAPSSSQQKTLNQELGLPDSCLPGEIGILCAAMSLLG